jgi:hypothetical protein
MILFLNKSQNYLVDGKQSTLEKEKHIIQMKKW